MPDITVKCLDEMERYTGSFERGQQFFFAGKSLGLSKLGMNAIRMPPNWEHYPEHDHASDNEEELYIPLEGSGTLYEGRPYQCSVASVRPPSARLFPPRGDDGCW
jgi:uncharacterized cupin superfamily protein